MALYPSSAMPGGYVKTRTTIEPVIEPEAKPGEKEPTITEPDDEPKTGPTSQTVMLSLRGLFLQKCGTVLEQNLSQSFDQVVN
jgi:hypothetical protein